MKLSGKATKWFLLVFLMGSLGMESAWAQFGRRDDGTITYEEIYDDPYDINKLFVALEPAIGDVQVANVMTGFGLEATYLMDKSADIRAHVRFPYYQGTDMARNAAENSPHFSGRARSYFYAEVGGTYHIWDKEEESSSHIALYSNSYKGNEWTAMVPKKTEVPNKQREILGARLGGIYYETTSELSRAISAQKVTVTSLAGDTLQATSDVFGNVMGGGLYLGGSYSWIKNFAAKPSRIYEELVDDHMFTTFLDLIIMPYTKVENFAYDGVVYDGSTINTFLFGARLGVDGKFNRKLGWSYGAEIGVRPGLQKRGFYGMIKIGFPVYGTKLDRTVEAFGK